MRGCQRLGEEGNGKWLLMGTEFLFGVMNMFWNQTVGTVVQPCEYTKSHGIAHFIMANFMVCELCLNTKKKRLRLLPVVGTWGPFPVSDHHSVPGAWACSQPEGQASAPGGEGAQLSQWTRAEAPGQWSYPPDSRV